MMTVVPFDAKTNKTSEQVLAYFLRDCSGIYGDESARSLVVEGTQGDATLRSL
jgi:alpha-amylase